MVGETTRRASDAAIAYVDAGVHELRGREDAMQLWRALRVTAGRAGSLRSEGIEPPFVGRDRELRLVKEHLHVSADERRAHLVSVIGIAGIGKSRLAWELYKYVDAIEQAVYWHRGRCLAYGDGVAYSALAEMVRMRTEIAEGEEAESARAKLRATLAVFVEDPEERAWIEPRLAHLLALADSKAGELPDLFAGWRLFFERIAEDGPVVLVFEDVQWADAPLLEFVDHLLEWSRNHPILVLALARPELADRHPHWGLRSRNSTSLSLEPLPRSAMEELLDGFVPGLPEDLRGQILDSAEGIPLYAVETVRMLLDRSLLEQHGDEYRPTGPIDSLDVPETLHGLIAARLDGLAAGERRVLQDASVLGKTFTRAALAAVTEQDAPDLDGVLEALVRKEILSLQADPRSPERGQYGFLQDLLRQVAYETLPRKERKARHLAAAEYLEQAWLDGDEDVVEIVASHYLVAIELDPKGRDVGDIRAEALSTLTRAGERAASVAASESAQRYFEQALELTDDPVTGAELHEQAGRMAARTGRPAVARSHFELAIELYDSVGRPLSVARVTATLGILAWTDEGDIERAIADMTGAYDVLVGEERSPELGLLAAQLARVLFFSGRADDAMARNELALEIAEALELPELLSHALMTRSLVLDGLGRLKEARLILRFALDLALEHDLTEVALRGYNNLAGAEESQNRLREALNLLRSMSELASLVGDRPNVLQADRSIVRILIELGDWDDALALFEELSRTSLEDPAATRAGLAMESFLVLLGRGELEEARSRWEAESEFVDRSDVQQRAAHSYCEAHLLLAEGRPREAAAPADDILAASLGVGHWTTWAGLEVGLEAATALGDGPKVDELLSFIETLPPGHVSPYVRALGARFGAHRAVREGEPEVAAVGFQTAADILRDMEKPFGVAIVQLEYAEWLTAEGRVEDAAEPSAEAREIFERLRATPWLDRLERVRVGASAGLPG